MTVSASKVKYDIFQNVCVRVRPFGFEASSHVYGAPVGTSEKHTIVDLLSVAVFPCTWFGFVLGGSVFGAPNIPYIIALPKWKPTQYNL